MINDNPAQRLHALLSEGKAQPSSTQCAATWHLLLKTDGDTASLMSRLGSAMTLPLEALTALKQAHGNDHDAEWNHWYVQVNSAFFGQQLGGPWGSFIDQIDVHAMGYLKLAATTLKQASTSKPADAEELLRLRAQISEIRKEVEESNFEEAIRRYVVDSLDRLLRKVDDYFLMGASPILREVESAMGHVLLDPAYGSFLKSSNLGQKLQLTLRATVLCVDPAIDTLRLDEALQQLAISMT